MDAQSHLASFDEQRRLALTLSMDLLVRTIRNCEPALARRGIRCAVARPARTEDSAQVGAWLVSARDGTALAPLQVGLTLCARNAREVQLQVCARLLSAVLPHDAAFSVLLYRTQAVLRTGNVETLEACVLHQQSVHLMSAFSPEQLASEVHRVLQRQGRRHFVPS